MTVFSLLTFFLAHSPHPIGNGGLRNTKSLGRNADGKVPRDLHDLSNIYRIFLSYVHIYIQCFPKFQCTKLTSNVYNTTRDVKTPAKIIRYVSVYLCYFLRTMKNSLGEIDFR